MGFLSLPLRVAIGGAAVGAVLLILGVGDDAALSLLQRLGAPPEAPWGQWPLRALVWGAALAVSALCVAAITALSRGRGVAFIAALASAALLWQGTPPAAASAAAALTDVSGLEVGDLPVRLALHGTLVAVFVGVLRSRR